LIGGGGCETTSSGQFKKWHTTACSTHVLKCLVPSIFTYRLLERACRAPCGASSRTPDPVGQHSRIEAQGDRREACVPLPNRNTHPPYCPPGRGLHGSVDAAPPDAPWRRVFLCVWVPSVPVNSTVVRMSKSKNGGT